MRTRRRRRHDNNPMDRWDRDAHFAMVMLAIVGAIGILRYVLDSYPIGVELATGVPALAAIGTGLASFGFSAKADKFKMAGLAMGLATFGILLLWLLRQWFPPD